MGSHLLAVLVVNAWAWGFAYLMTLWCRQLGRTAHLGYYLVLMPIGFYAWSDPKLWFLAGFAMIGLLTITGSLRRLLRLAYNSPLQPPPAGGE